MPFQVSNFHLSRLTHPSMINHSTKLKLFPKSHLFRCRRVFRIKRQTIFDSPNYITIKLLIFRQTFHIYCRFTLPNPSTGEVGRGFTNKFERTLSHYNSRCFDRDKLPRSSSGLAYFLRARFFYKFRQLSYNIIVTTKYYFFMDETEDHGLSFVDPNFPLFLLCGVLSRKAN